jgi:hypothetical protein
MESTQQQQRDSGNPAPADSTVRRLVLKALAEVKKPARLAMQSVALVVFVLVHLASEGSTPGGETTPGSERAGGYGLILSQAFWYQKSINIGARRMVDDHVAVVLIGLDEPQRVRNDICTQRRFMAMLLSASLEAPPSLIVLDKFYGPEACADAAPKDPPAPSKSHPRRRRTTVQPSQVNRPDSTTLMINAIRQVAARNVPVVYALKAYSEEELQAVWPSALKRAKERGLRSDELVLEKGLEFPEVRCANGVQCLIGGLYNFNSDTRKVPLNWLAYRSIGEISQQPVDMDTLAVAAVKASNPPEELLERIQTLRSQHRHPFSAFLAADKFKIHAASELVCSGAEKEVEWVPCPASATKASALDDLRGRIVVIGQSGPGLDIHPSIMGSVPGVILQANYIEALRDNRFLKPAHWSITLLLILIWSELILWGFDKFEMNLLTAMLYSLAAILISALLVWVVANLLIGYYVEVLLPTMLGLVALVFAHRFLERPSSRAPQNGGQREANLTAPAS